MSKTNINEVEINGVEYVRKDSLSNDALAAPVDGMEYVVIRERDSGCHAGYLAGRDGANVTLLNARRLWYWDGAVTLSQLAREGVGKPDRCKFDLSTKIEVLGVCEILSVTEEAKASIEAVKLWKA